MKNIFEPIRNYVLNAIAERSKGESELIPSEYWTDFAINFRYVYDLGDSELNRIRFHTYHLTSDFYLTYYFAAESYKSLLERGYRYFLDRNKLEQLEEGLDGIGVISEYGRISHDLVRYLGVINDLLDAGLFDRDTSKRIIEIGGGYGGLARAHIMHNPKSTYFICDLEETIFFSAVYLSKHLGVDKVHLVEGALDDSSIEQGHVYIVPQSKMEYFDALRFDYAISQQSLQEMTQKQVERYLDWLSRNVNYLYSCNIYDHASIADSKNLVVNLPKILESYFPSVTWKGAEPLIDERFGDNHLLRSVYKCL